MTTIGHGTTASGSGGEGVLRAANNTDQILAVLRDEKLDDVILVAGSPSATAVLPPLAKVRGVICHSGRLTSHLAIVSRELGVHCLMGAELGEDESLERARVQIDGDGTVARFE